MPRMEFATATVLLALLALLAACASEQPKEPAPAAPAPAAIAPKPRALPATRPVAQPSVPANPLHDAAGILAKRSVFYPLDGYDVNGEYRPLVEAHARYLRDHPGAMVVVQGNCDERGSREYNLVLGQRRAANVVKAMTLLGVPERQIEAVSFGEEKPRAPGHDEAAWAQNRRSDIVYARER